VEYYIDRPAATTILAAAKISGKTASGTSIGILESITQREQARYVHADSSTRTSVIEPEANYLAARVKQDVLSNSSIGIMATAVNQKSLHPHYTGSADWTLRFHEGDYVCSGQAVGSRTGHDENGWGGVLMLEKQGGEDFRGSIRGEYLDRKLDLNRMGFLRRNNYREGFVWLQYRTTDTWWVIRKTWHNINAGMTDNLDGVRLTRGGNYNNSIELVNFWSLGGGIWTDFQNIYSDAETRGGPPAPVPAGQNWWLWLSTDGRKPWRFEVNAEAGDTWDGRYDAYGLWMEFRPRSNIEFSLGPGYIDVRRRSRWLTYLEDDEGNRSDEIFGEQYMRRFDMTVRGTLTFTRDLTLQVYAQPFFASVDYRDFKKLVPPDGFEPVDSTVYNERVEQPDFSWSSMNSNVILRWEYRPGSALYLVWTQAREVTVDDGGFNLDHHWGNLRDAAPHNTFLVKVNYWWSL
jgi:hypothetical protein